MNSSGFLLCVFSCVGLIFNDQVCAWSLTSSSRRNAIQKGGAIVVSTIFGAEVANAVDLKDDYMQGTAALANMDADAPVPREAYKKLGSGVIYADLRPGKGDATVTEGSRVNLQWVRWLVMIWSIQRIVERDSQIIFSRSRFD